MDITLLLLILFYCFALWLGLYLINRDWRESYLLMAGLGLANYAGALGFRALLVVSPGATILQLLHQFFIYQPALLWAGGLLNLLPEESSYRKLLPFYYYGQILTTELLIIFNLIGAFPDLGVVLVVGLPVFIYLLILIFELREYQQPSRLSLTVVGTIFFGLSIGLLIPNDWVPQIWVILGIGGDLIVLGVGIAVHDAFQEGQSLRRSMGYSLVSTLIVCLLIGLHMTIAIQGLGLSPALISLLIGLLRTGIALVVFGPGLLQNTVTRAVETSTRDLEPGIDFNSIPDADFTRFTRRALSYLDDLPKLAGSPLTQLPLIEARLESREVHIDTLARADELKKVLIEGIERLRPQTDRDFGTTDEWRFYNAIYYPYVAGIKPSRRSQGKAGLTKDEAAALDWFRREVPERTLHNWQNKAAALIALSMRETSGT